MGELKLVKTEFELPFRFYTLRSIGRNHMTIDALQTFDQ